MTTIRLLLIASVAHVCRAIYVLRATPTPAPPTLDTNADIPTMISYFRGLRGLPNDKKPFSGETNGTGLDLAIDVGPRDAQIILFVHGWPDTPEVWSNQIDNLKNDYRCVAVRLPGFGEKLPAEAPWGYDFDTLADMLAKTATDLKRANGGEPIIFVAHDQGAWVTYMVERKHPDLFKALVSFDVSPGGKPGPKWLPALLRYQYVATRAFLERGDTGDSWIQDYVSNELAKSAGWEDLLNKSNKQDILTPTPLNKITSAMCYPYYWTWRTGDINDAKWKTQTYQGWEDDKRGELPKCPTLFLHGTAGVRGLSGDAWCEALKERNNSDCVAIESHHWLMASKAAEVNRHVDNFFQSVPGLRNKPVQVGFK